MYVSDVKWNCLFLSQYIWIYNFWYKTNFDSPHLCGLITQITYDFLYMKIYKKKDAWLFQLHSSIKVVAIERIFIIFRINICSKTCLHSETSVQWKNNKINLVHQETNWNKCANWGLGVIFLYRKLNFSLKVEQFNL